LGRNGVGKTRLCRSIVGFTPARAGRVMFGSVEITSWRPHNICGLGLSVVPQGRRIFPSLTVDEHLAIAARAVAGSRVLPHTGATSARPEAATAIPRSEPSDLEAGWDVQRIFDLFPRLRERRDHRGQALSGGEQQM